MNKRIKKLWVEALRSGDYKQGHYILKNIVENQEEFCCLGVLSDLYFKEHLNEQWVKDDDGLEAILVKEASYFENELLTNKIARWAKCDIDPSVDITNYKHISNIKKVLEKANENNMISLAVLNDCGSSFELIANLIEEQL